MNRPALGLLTAMLTVAAVSIQLGTARGADDTAHQALAVAVDSTIVDLSATPADIVIDEVRNLAYVSATNTDEIIEVDLNTLTIEDRHFLPDPVGMDIASDGDHLYVASFGSTSIYTVDLTDWSSTQTVLSDLGDSRTWDVIEIAPEVVLVSANPGSNGLAYIVKYDFGLASQARVADETIIRAGPRFAMDGGDNAFVGSGFSPNSLYRLDLTDPTAPIAAEDSHGSVSGTQRLAVSPDGSYLIIGSGQKIDAATITPVGTVPGGTPLFSDDGSEVMTLSHVGEQALVSVSNGATTQLLDELMADCGPSPESWLPDSEFVKATGSADLLATTSNSLCVIHSATPAPVPTTTTTTVGPPGGGRFFDDDSSTFQNDIEAIATDGVTKGCNPPFGTGYCPDDFVTRGQMAAFMVRAMGYTDNGGGDIFDDDDGSTFENDIDKLATAGVTKGCNPPTNNHYCPNDFVTRGQMAAFIVRALGYTDNGGGDIFDDDDGSTFENDIDKLATAGVTKGCNPPTNNHYCPNDFVTRGQMGAFLARALTLPKDLDSAATGDHQRFRP